MCNQLLHDELVCCVGREQSISEADKAQDVRGDFVDFGEMGKGTDSTVRLVRTS